MISRHRALERAALIGFGLILLLPFSADPLFSIETPQPAVVTSVGMGAPPGAPTAGPTGAVEDAAEKAVLSYLYATLGRDEFFRLSDAIDTLILPNYPSYITKTEIRAVSEMPGGDTAVVSAAVTIDTAALSAGLENIRRLEGTPQGPRILSPAEKEILVSKAQAIYIQGEVASDILLDRLRGIESFLSAKTLFETAESTEGVYRCLMGTGRAHTSLGDVSAALADYNEALELAVDMKRPDHIAAIRIARARLMAASGNPIGARRDIAAVLDNPSIPGSGGLTAEALLIDADLDYRSGDYESAASKLARAVAIFEAVADVKRLTQAHLLMGLVLIAGGDGPGAIGSFKLAKTLAGKFDDGVSAAKALIGMARASRIAGDPKSAALYLADALKTVRDSGWAAGEIACLCEEAYTRADLGDNAGGREAAVTAHALASVSTDPALIAAAFRAMGEVSRSDGDGAAAFDALASCIEISSDIRVVGRDVPFLFFGDAQRDAALSHFLALAADTGRAKRAFIAVAGYEGTKAAREALMAPPAQPARDEALMMVYRDAAMRAIAADEAAAGGEYAGFADTSRAESSRLSDEAIGSLDAAEARIAREAPRLAAWLGIKGPNPADLSRSMPADAALVHYVVNPGGAHALVVTTRGISIIDLADGYGDISDALTRLTEAAGALHIAVEDEIPLDFTEASTSLTSMLVSPVLPGLAGGTTIGISPGEALGTLPIPALGRYNEEGRFIFLGEELTLFATSWLFPVTAVFVPAGDTAAACDILAVGEIDLPVSETAGHSTGPETPAGSDGDRPPPPDEAGFLRVARCPSDSNWWETETRLVVFPEKGLWGASGFSRIEYLAYLTDRPVIVVPETAGGMPVTAFLEETIAASRGTPVLSGYADAVKIMAAHSRSGGNAEWIRFNLIHDFVSIRK